MPEELTVDIRPFGPDPAVLQQRAENLLATQALRGALGKARHQLLSVEMLEPESKVAGRGRPTAFAPPSTTTRTIGPCWRTALCGTRIA